MKTVLLIDDDHAIRSMLRQWLETEGWQVLEAEDGEAGISLSRQHRPRAIICDLLMPRCNGFQVCRAVRRQFNSTEVRIIVTTGSAYATDRFNALEAGADEYLVKPFKPADLAATLDRLLRNGAPRADEAGPTPLSDNGATTTTFWGVRGSIPTPGSATVFYGGNTSCVEVRACGQIIILDAGTGIRALGLQLAREFKNNPLEATLLISHTHWDHIQGFPFFAPAYQPRNRLRVLGFDGARKGLESTLSSQMESPFFPIPLQHMTGHLSIEELKEMQFQIGQIPVQAAFLNHPGVCVGYRLFTPAGSIAYLPDNELFQRLKTADTGPEGAAPEVRAYAEAQDQRIVDFVRDSHVLIIDAQYDSQEYPTHVGWGHSCVEDAVALGVKANVRQLFLFHHDPNHDDAQISRMVASARETALRLGSSMQIEAAREGMSVVLD